MTVEITLLGGVGEFGRNCLLLDDEELGAAVVIDCGLKVVDGGANADGEQGARVVELPDLEALRKVRDRLVGYVITHGHDDHIGGLPEAMGLCPAPVFATRFTRERIRQRFRRAGKPSPELMAVDAEMRRHVGPFLVEWVHVSHSIPDATAVLVHTSEGVVVHSGDFRVDEDPLLGPPTDMAALTRAGDEGIALLMSDSTGATLPGDNPGERSVVQPLAAALEGAEGRVLVTTFSTHVQRLQMIMDLCKERNRRVIPIGRGMRDVVNAARQLNLLKGEGVLMAEGDLWAVPPSYVCLLATGSQAEPGSALWRIANGHHARVTLEKGDRVVFSTRTIPGNEDEVEKMRAKLREAGVEVYDGREGRHVSGHGHSGDLARLLQATRPTRFLALHGEDRMLEAHRALARANGVGDEGILMARNGDRLRLVGKEAHVISRAPSPPAGI